MKKTVSPNLDQVYKSMSGISDIRVLDFLSAVVETEFQISDLFCFEENPHPYLNLIWDNTSEANRANINKLAPITLSCLRGSTALDQLFGMARKGKRCAYIGASRLRHVTESGIPFVIHKPTNEFTETGSGNLFQLVARTPQEAADFCLVAHKIAELALCPGILLFQPNFDLIEFNIVKTVSLENMSAYIGLADDRIKSPTKIQQEIYGETRRRIPDDLKPYTKIRNEKFEEELFQIVLQAILEFNTLTGREYGLIETMNVQNADLIFIAAGKHFEWLEKHLTELDKKCNKKIGLIHPTILTPFPAHLILPLLKGKTGLVLDSSPEHLLFREIQLGLEKAFVNGLQQTRSFTDLPYPLYPVFDKMEDRPSMYAFEALGDRFDLDQVVKIIDTIFDRTSATNHFRLAAASSKQSPKTEKKSDFRNVLRLIYRSPNSFYDCRNLIEKMHRFFDLKFKLFGKPDADLLFASMSKSKIQNDQSQLLADILIFHDPLASSLLEDLALLGDGGILICFGNPENSDRIWQSMSSENRSLIIKKQIKFYLIDALDFAQTPNDRNAVVFGSFLKVTSENFRNLIDNTNLTKIREILASNGDLNFEKAFQHGFASIREVNVSEAWEPPSSDFFQTEPGVIHEEEAELSAIEDSKRDKIYRELLRFYLSGKKEIDRANILEDSGMVPIHLHPFRDFSRFRNDYPICLLERVTQEIAIPLTQIFDKIIAQLEAEGDEGEKIKRDILRLESAIKTLVEDGITGRLSKLWDLAVDGLIKELHKEESKERLNQNLAIAREELDFEGEVLGYGKKTIEFLFQVTAQYQGSQVCKKLFCEVDELVDKLKGVLKSDTIHSPESRDPEFLEASFGLTEEQEFDFNTLSHILEEAPHGQPLSQKQRNRIETTLEILHSKEILFSQSLSSNSESFNLFIKGGRSEDKKLAVSVGKFYAELQNFVRFFRAVRVGKLEVENKYIEEKHDPFFAGFKLQQLTREETEAIPPFVVNLSAEDNMNFDQNILADILSSSIPIKILIISNKLVYQSGAQFNFEWFAKLAYKYLADKNAFILQTVSSNFQQVLDGFNRGLNFKGPALFCIFDDSETNSQQLHPYFTSAMALESRAFPGFIFDPGMEDGLALQFELAFNPQIESDWSAMEIAYLTADKEERSENLAFTFADYLSTDSRFHQHFQPASRNSWLDKMMPITDYLKLGKETRSGKIPFILMVDKNGILHRVICSSQVINATENVSAHWRDLQELVGIGSLHLERLVEVEKAKIEERKRKELDEIEVKHKRELDRTVGELTKEIVSNIASGLLNDSFSASIHASAPSLPAAVIADQPGEVSETLDDALPDAEPAVEEEEEQISFDDPYIETPRCTACNECTNINPRLFSYNDNKQAYIKDAAAGTFRELVEAAEKCPVHIIHPGKPKNPDERNLEELIKRAEPFQG